MAKNVIYYGPPGTGKTHFIQKQMEKYTDYKIDDEDIKKAYMMKSYDWMLIALVIMQNNNPMSSDEIIAKIIILKLGYYGTVSDVLENHSISNSSMGLKRESPRIFFDEDGKWFVDRLKLLEYEPDFINTYIKNISIDKRYEFITFHQSFSYEDFVEGIRPSVDPISKQLIYNPQPGIFKIICQKANSNRSKQYALFIDEINRGNISEVFGELISLIEVDKREGEPYQLEAVLPYSKTMFSVPNNLNIFGTMNSADKSIATIDLALRRRFEFINFSCDYHALAIVLEAKGLNPNNIDSIDVIKLLKVINKRINLLLDSDYEIGHAYFMGVNSMNDISNVITKKIIPLLEEYFFDDLQKIQIVLNDIDESGRLATNAIYVHQELEPEKLIKFIGDYNIENKNVYYINDNINKDSITKIYDGVKL